MVLPRSPLCCNLVLPYEKDGDGWCVDKNRSDLHQLAQADVALQCITKDPVTLHLFLSLQVSCSCCGNVSHVKSKVFLLMAVVSLGGDCLCHTTPGGALYEALELHLSLNVGLSFMVCMK